VLYKHIERLRAYKNGEIELRFTDGSTLTAGPDMAYENWDIVGAGHLLIVCMPGGELAVWYPGADTPAMRRLT
jgi:hypothetical protein